MVEKTGLLSLSSKQVIDNLREGVIITDANLTILAINPTFSKVTGYSESDVIGKKPNLLKSGMNKAGFYTRMWTSINNTAHWQGEIINKRKNGELYTEWLTITGIKDNTGATTHYIGVFTDITKRKRAQETIRHMAYYDSLTDLPNRALFREQLRNAIAHAERRNEFLGVLFVDLDRLKVINDTLGHPMGDRLLIGVAERLKSCLRATDTVARLGGDEYMILLTDIKNVEEIMKLTEKVLETVRPPFIFDGQELYTTASIGISVYPHDGNDTETLMKNADTAMYRAKHRGRNNFQLFDASMKAEIHQQLVLENGLRRALDRGEFVVYYQPQIDLPSGQIVGMEALLRWQHPELGLIAPTTFMHWAEDSGLIMPIGELVLEMACEQNKRWMDSGFSGLKVGVNVSARQMRHSDIVKTVERTLKKTGLPPNCLDLELTESVLMELTGQAMYIPHALKAMGVGFSIDDFGTGYSSLSYLKRLPVTTLKMDQSFVRDLTSDGDDHTIANAVIALGHGLSLNVLAEGVETEGQLDSLKNLKCDQVQGFFFSQPLSAPIFEQLLKEKKSFSHHGTLFEGVSN